MAEMGPLPGMKERRRGPGDWGGEAQEWLRSGPTHHRVAGLKHLAEQDAALLFGKWFSERIQDTRVLGIEAVWALRDQGRAVNVSTCQMPVA